MIKKILNVPSAEVLRPAVKESEEGKLSTAAKAVAAGFRLIGAENYRLVSC